MAAHLNDPDVRIVDARCRARYENGRGISVDDHKGYMTGHIPGAVNVPYFANIDPALATAAPADRDRLLASDLPFTFSSPESLAALYGEAGVTPDREVITYCGRGYAAARGMLALKLLGYERVRLYDGSWTEWSADPDLPVEVSSPPTVN